MPRSFRFQPPSPRPPSLTRPRLLRALLGRWEHRVTTVVGGAGLGKTTLLAQAIGENRLAPRGDDVWIGVEPGDGAGAPLARDLLSAIVDGPPDPTSAPAAATAGGASGPPSPEAVANAVWQRTPAAVCLVIDDVHHLPTGSFGAAWLAELVEALPENGHVLLAGRVDAPVPLARRAARGELLQIREQDLRFTGDEVASFATDRGIADASRLAAAGGWPAMTELAASVPGDHAGDYLWEEVLAPLGDRRRRVLAVVADLGGADDALAGAALDEPVDLGVELAGVPLLAADERGWRIPHPLWRSTPALSLSADDQRAVRRRAIEHHVAGGRFDDALTLATDSAIDEVVPSILRAACLGPGRPPVDRLARWLADLPPEAAGSSGAVLARGLHLALVSPAESIEPLRRAADLFRDEGDVDGELAAIALVGRVAWWLAQVDVLGTLYPRIVELEAEGHALARALAGIGRAVLADLAGDDEGVLAALDGIEPGTLDHAWASVADWLRASTLVGAGRAAEALEVLDGVSPSDDPAFAATTDGGRLAALWALGELDAVAAALPSLLDRVRAAGLAQNVLVGLAQSAVLWATVGDLSTARANLDEARRAEGEAGGGPTARVGLAEATILAAGGDEAAATALIEDVIAAHGLASAGDRRSWRVALPLVYVLVPATRASWDAADLAGHLDDARALARAVTGLREGEGDAVATLVARGVPSVRLMRSLLIPTLAAELATGLHATGLAEGPALLDALEAPGRDAVRALAGGATSAAGPARTLLAAVPAPPPDRLEVGVLGPLDVRSGGRSVAGDLRRGRVRALLSFLAAHPHTTRAAVETALWPDRDDKAAANNLRVTLNYLLGTLEPKRGKGEPSFFVRQDATTLTLATGEWLQVDADEFDEHVRRAAVADRDGVPSVALEHSLAAAALYRGPAYQDAGDAEWVDLQRQHYSTRFVGAAVRAGQLLVGRGDPEQAEALAARALAVDEWSDDAYAVAVSAALARDDRGAARRTMERADAALAELGAEPSSELQRLRRRLRYRT